MPKDPLVRIDVSAELPQAVVFGGDTFLGESFLAELLGNQLQVTAVVKKKDWVFSGKERENLLTVPFSGGQKSLPAKVDYVVDFYQTEAAVRLAVKKKARLLSVVNLEEKSHPPSFSSRPADWRLLKTAFVYGPEPHSLGSTLLNRMILEAVFNLPVRIPFSEKGRVFPLYITDFCQALTRVLFLSGLAGEEFILLGRSVSLARFLRLVEKKAKNTAGIRVDPNLVLPPGEKKEKREENYQRLGWQPETRLVVGVGKTVQFFFQKQEKGEIKKEDLLPPPEMSGEEKAAILVPEAKKEEKPALTQDFWSGKPLPTKPVVARKKRKKRKKKVKKIMIEEVLEEGKEEVPPLPLASEEEKEEKSAEKKEVKKKEKKEKKRGRRGAVVFFFLLFLLFWGGINLWGAVFNLGWGAICLKRSLALSKSQHFPEAISLAEKAERSFSRASDWAADGSPFLLFKLAQVGKKTSRSLWLAVRLGQETNKIVQGVLQGEETNLKEEKEFLKSNSRRLVWQLGLLEAELSGRWPLLPQRWRNQPWLYQEKVKKTKKEVEKAAAVIDQLDWFLGEGGRRSFLVLLQNNSELRPTGGFIGSFALLNFSHGSLLDFEVKDVYVADGQLKGHVEPPAPIKEVLGEANWYLRDSNWNSDFPASARNAAWFLEKEMGITPDGVIAFNLAAAQKIIASLGEIYLPDFNEKINQKNLFERAEFYSEANFFPGSTQKASFLASLGKQLFATIKTANQEEYLRIAAAIYQSLEEKEIMVWTKNQVLNQELKENNWLGEIKNFAPQKGLWVDYLFLVEANLGVNKVNYFLRRSLEESIQIKKTGEIDHVLKINYENTAQSSNWPGGDYKNYLRLFLPRESQFSQVFVYDPLAGGEKKEFPADQVKQTTVAGKEVLSFLVKVPVASRRTVEVHFSQKTSFPSGRWRYLLYLQKQSGLGATPITILVSYPSGWTPLQVNPAATTMENSLLFNQQFNGDIPLGIEFSRE